MSSSCRASCSMYAGSASLAFWACRFFTWASMVCCWATSESICRRWVAYSRIGYARLSTIAQITTASTAARLVSRVDRGAAGGDISRAGVRAANRG